MTVIHRIRIYHATLAILAILSYVTGELGIIHSWLGYGVALVIIFRLFWALLSGDRQVGLARFYPSFEGFSKSNIFTHPAISKVFMLSIAVSLILVSLTGIMMDKGKAIGLADARILTSAYASDDHHNDNEDSDEEEGFLMEAHELFANLMLFFVGTHVAYILIFKLPLAKFMLFIPKNKNK